MLIGNDLWVRVRDRVVERIESERTMVSGGGCAKASAEATAMAYADHIGVIRALEWVMAQAREIADPPKPPQEPTEDY